MFNELMDRLPIKGDTKILVSIVLLSPVLVPMLLWAGLKDTWGKNGNGVPKQTGRGGIHGHTLPKVGRSRQ